MAGTKTKSKNSLNEGHTCQYCGKTFVKETTLIAHQCELKRRIAQQNETGVRLGFYCFNKFYEYIKSGEAEKTYRNFADSPYYLAFVKFGRYLVEIRAVEPEAYCEWLLKHNKKLDHWCKDSYYEEYLLEYTKQEPAAPALDRSIQTMNQWAEENKSRLQDYFKYATNNRISFDVQSGRISAWIIYTSKTGSEFLSRLTNSELVEIWEWIDSEHWDKNFQKRKIDFEWAKEVTKEAGL